MPPLQRTVFLLDIDNTLLDNDRVLADLQRHVAASFGDELAGRYWSIFEELRDSLGYADYLGALQRFRVEQPNEPNLLQLSSYLVDYPFANRLYPESIDVIEHLSQWGPTVILSDGDVVFQPRKAERSGLAEAVEQRVLIYVHKEEMLDDVAARFPAEHYVMVDDKLRLLTAIGGVWGGRVTTVFVRQGHYATDPTILAAYPPATLDIQRIGDLLAYDFGPSWALASTPQRAHAM